MTDEVDARHLLWSSWAGGERSVPKLKVPWLGEVLRWALAWTNGSGWHDFDGTLRASRLGYLLSRGQGVCAGCRPPASGCPAECNEETLPHLWSHRSARCFAFGSAWQRGEETRRTREERPVGTAHPSARPGLVA